MNILARRPGRFPALGVVDVEEQPLSLRNEENDAASRERLTMAVNHLTAFVIFFYGLYALCRFGFGYDPIRDSSTPPSYTLEIPGITHRLRGYNRGP